MSFEDAATQLIVHTYNLPTDGGTDEKNREKFAKISAVLISLWQSSRQKLSSATIMPEYTAQCDIFKKNWFKTQNYMFAAFFFPKQ